MNNRWTKLGGLMAAAAVVLGAFGAHGLESYLVRKYDSETRQVLGQTVPAAEKYMDNFQTAARYQMTHSIALLITGLLISTRPRRSLTVAAWCFLGGTVLFSGSLYVLVLSGLSWLGAVTPIGGVLMIVGWLALAAGSCPGGSPHCTAGSTETTKQTSANVE
ncbi:MAG: DUF423 domain-containing protein [Pirellulales bacterium]|nr:DUF423 domain-containing protein [Pirellulales bacterium]